MLSDTGHIESGDAANMGKSAKDGDENEIAAVDFGIGGRQMVGALKLAKQIVVVDRHFRSGGMVCLRHPA